MGGYAGRWVSGSVRTSNVWVNVFILLACGYVEAVNFVNYFFMSATYCTCPALAYIGVYQCFTVKANINRVFRRSKRIHLDNSIYMHKLISHIDMDLLFASRSLLLYHTTTTKGILL